MYDAINTNVLNHHPGVTSQELKRFDSLLHSRKIPKKTIFISPGDISTTFNYITKGLVISYIINEKGEKVVLNFLKEDWWASDIESFHLNTPGKIYFETIEDTEMLFITKENKAILVKEFPNFECLFYYLLRRYVVNLQNRFLGQITTPAKERYDQFMDKYPDISQRVPQKYIASYLGITPEFLSKLRASRG